METLVIEDLLEKLEQKILYILRLQINRIALNNKNTISALNKNGHGDHCEFMRRSMLEYEIVRVSALWDPGKNKNRFSIIFVAKKSPPSDKQQDLNARINDIFNGDSISRIKKFRHEFAAHDLINPIADNKLLYGMLDEIITKTLSFIKEIFELNEYNHDIDSYIKSFEYQACRFWNSCSADTATMPLRDL